MDHHSDLPLVRGFLRFHPPRGVCEIRGAGPHLWFAAAGALGFRVTPVRCAYTQFVDLIGRFCGSPRRLAPVPRHCNPCQMLFFWTWLPCRWDRGRISTGRRGAPGTYFSALAGMMMHHVLGGLC